MVKSFKNNLQTAKNGCSIILKTEDLRQKMFREILTQIFNNFYKN